jgi:nucleoside-diphosphate-sugar epimerase
MDILVTGCTGFVGSAVVKALLEDNNRVFCLSRSLACPFSGRSSHICQDIGEELSSAGMPSRLDGIVHAAAIMDSAVDNAQMYRINTLGTLHALEYAREAGVKNFLFTSTGGVYGYCQAASGEDAPINPANFYCCSKYNAENLVACYRQYFSASILRLFFPYGPGQVRGIVPRLFKNIAEGTPVQIYEGDAPRINPVYISDVVRMIMKLIRVPDQVTVNLAGDDVVSVRQLAAMIGAALGKDAVFSSRHDDSISNLIGDNTKMKAECAIIPAVSLAEGISSVASRGKR